MKMLEVLPTLCCGPGTAPLDVAERDALAARFKALSDPTRVAIVNRLAAADEVCVCDFVASLDLAQPTVSHHLKTLHDAGLLGREQRGKWAYYSLNRDAVAKLAAVADLKEACC
jgi:ArsR family transcriptional regulator, arsenate/arsenite/antimonite-responsive transcriptional repressor